MSAVRSFEVTRGAESGDMLSRKEPKSKLKVGLLTTAYFEFFRMYERLEAEAEADAKLIVERLSASNDLIASGLVSTMDAADSAGRRFKDAGIDVLVIAEVTYTTDYIVHQVLKHLPKDIPLVVFCCQQRASLDPAAGYDQSLRNSGPMGTIQLAGSFCKMRKHEKFQLVIGSIEDDEAYNKINRCIQVRRTIAEIEDWTIGIVGHVFRGMFDFQYDRTALQGKLGPHVMELKSSHLLSILEEFSESSPEVIELRDRVYSNYSVSGLDEWDVLNAARLAVALKELVVRHKLDGLALLGQYYIEQMCNSTCHLGLSEILLSDMAMAVTEGDVLGLIVAKVLKDFTGQTPFFGEWEECDFTLNAVMILGHGFSDPRTDNLVRPRVGPACEQWGFEGNGFGFQSYPKSGVATLSHIVQTPDRWRMLVAKGEILDQRFEKLGEGAMVVAVDRPVDVFLERIMRWGLPHHVIVGYGDVTDQLKCFAEQLDIEVCSL